MRRSVIQTTKTVSGGPSPTPSKSTRETATRKKREQTEKQPPGSIVVNEAGNGFGVNEQTVAVVEVVVVAVCQSTRAGVHSAQFTEVLPSLVGSCSYIYRDTLRSRSLIFYYGRHGETKAKCGGWKREGQGGELKVGGGGGVGRLGERG